MSLHVIHFVQFNLFRNLEFIPKETRKSHFKIEHTLLQSINIH